MKLVIPSYSPKGYYGNTVWDLEEFVDGAFIRVIWNRAKLSIQFRGEDEETYIATHILSELLGIFTLDKLKEVFCQEKYMVGPIVLLVRATQMPEKLVLTLVDILHLGEWLTRADVRIIAAQLGINTPGYLGEHTIESLAQFLRTKPLSCMRNALIKKVIGRSDQSVIKINVKDVIKYELD